MILGGVLFIIGLVIGSAINSYLWRYQTKTTYKGRSMCPVCKHQINWYDNIPLVSWFLLSGKCRYCKKSISVQYPTVELITGLAFLLIGVFSKAGIYVAHVSGAMFDLGQIFTPGYFALGLFILTLLLAIASILIMIAVYDYKTKIIPNGFNYAFIALTSLYLVASQVQIANFKFSAFGQGIWPYLLSGAVAFLFFYGLVYFSKETWMGGGDAKMALGIGLLLGPTGTLLAIMTASITGSIYGVGTILSSKVKSKKLKSKSNKNLSTLNFGLSTGAGHEIPFGPFLALGTYFAMVFGPAIISWYVKIVLGI
jgi:leader peptidase (prepilin peptidase) / N-methyltransferase